MLSSWLSFERLVFEKPIYFLTHVSDIGVIKMGKYRTVRIAENLAKQIDTVVEGKNLGYCSRAEVVKEAVRNLLATIEQDKNR